MTDIHIVDFIRKFHTISKTNDIDEVFTCGCCYWFAVILNQKYKNSPIMYDPIANHFMVLYNGRLYDITGDVTNKYKPILWDDFNDELEKKRILDYCINFTR